MMHRGIAGKKRQPVKITLSLFEEAGFTLVELLIALVMSVVVVGAVYYTFNSQQKSFSLINQKIDMQQEGRAALNFMMRDFRMAGARVPKSKALVITDATDGPDEVSLLFASPEEYFLSGYIIVSSATGRSDSIVVETMAGGSFALKNSYYRNKNIVLVQRDESHSVIRKISKATGRERKGLSPWRNPRLRMFLGILRMISLRIIPINMPLLLRPGHTTSSPGPCM